MNPYASPPVVVERPLDQRPDGKHCPGCSVYIGFWRPTRLVGDVLLFPPQLRMGIHCPECRAIIHYRASKAVVLLSAVNVILFGLVSNVALIAYRPFAWQIIVAWLVGVFVPIQLTAHWYLRNYKVLSLGLSGRPDGERSA